MHSIAGVGADHRLSLRSGTRHPHRGDGGEREGAELGILFKQAEVFERATEIDTVVFDKTGTLTTGVMESPRKVSSDEEMSRIPASRGIGERWRPATRSGWRSRLAADEERNGNSREADNRGEPSRVRRRREGRREPRVRLGYAMLMAEHGLHGRERWEEIRGHGIGRGQRRSWQDGMARYGVFSVCRLGPTRGGGGGGTSHQSRHRDLDGHR